MWLIGEFEAVTLFSLKPSYATSSGGKTLLTPTPFAVKMALLDAACRTLGLDGAKAHWPDLCSLYVALRPAENIVVTNLFQRILRLYKNAPKPGTPDFGPFQRTIGYREYAHMAGPFSLALGWDGSETRAWLEALVMQVNYLGKRGCFVQLLAPPAAVSDLAGGFVSLTEEASAYRIDGVLQLLDDCAPNLTFAQADIYSGEKIKMGKERITRNIVLPCRLTRSSKSFTLYERIEG